MYKYEAGFIGCGNMGGALARALTGKLLPGKIELVNLPENPVWACPSAQRTNCTQRKNNRHSFPGVPEDNGDNPP